MGSKWIVSTAAEFCESVRDGTHDSPKPVNYNGHPLVTSKHITSNRLDLANAYLISEEDFRQIEKRSKVDQWDVLITMIGTVGEPCLISYTPDFAIKNIGLFKSKGQVEGQYLYYYLLSPLAQDHIRTRLRGTTQQYIPLAELRALPVFHPTCKSDMEAIAHILGSLDDKIELNRRMNATLEAMAQALFQSWFVDFDPVIDKALAAGNPIPEPLQQRAQARRELGEKRKPLPADVARHFPDRFVFTEELGWVPEGWEVMPLLDVCDLKGGAQPPARMFVNEPRDGYVRLLQIRDFTNDNHMTYVPDSGKLRYVSEDEILIGRYGSASGNRRTDSLGRICRGKCGVYNVALMKLAPRLAGPEFCLQLYDSDLFYNYLYGTSNKAVQSGFSKNELLGCYVCLPGKELREGYELFGGLIWSRKKRLNEISRTITALRDTLLPKLLSGELRVPDAERLVAEV